MPNPSKGLGNARALPARPNLEHLKNEAKQLLCTLRARLATAKLTEAQFQIAREYGFPSWRQLKAEVEKRSREVPLHAETSRSLANYIGHYRHDPQFITNSVVTVTCDDGHLFAQETGGGKVKYAEQGAGRFTVPGLPGSLTFENAEAQPATALIVHTPESQFRLERTDDEGAAKARADYGQALADQKRSRAEIAVEPAILERYVGTYASPNGTAWEVSREAHRLFVQRTGVPARLEVYAETETDFFWRIVPSQISFVLEAGNVIAAVLHQGGHDLCLARVSAADAERSTASVRKRFEHQQRPRTVVPIDPDLLAAYVGRYRLTQEIILTVTAEDGRLFTQLTGQTKLEAYPESERDFFWTAYAAQITFVTDAGGRVTHAIRHQIGRDIPMMRIDETADEHVAADLRAS